MAQNDPPHLNFSDFLPNSALSSQDHGTNLSRDVTMNILEDQVTDLTYLADTPIPPISPIAVSGSMNGQRQSSSAESPADTGPGGGKKRKNDETDANGSTHTRAKRNRYISIAWYTCQLL